MLWLVGRNDLKKNIIKVYFQAHVYYSIYQQRLQLVELTGVMTVCCCCCCCVVIVCVYFIGGGEGGERGGRNHLILSYIILLVHVQSSRVAMDTNVLTWNWVV